MKIFKTKKNKKLRVKYSTAPNKLKKYSKTPIKSILKLRLKYSKTPIKNF